MSSVALDFLTGRRPVSDLVDTVTIETRFTPPITIKKPLASNGAPPNPLLSLFKPKIIVTSPLWASPHTSTPWGDPGPTLWPEVKIVLGVVGVVVAVVLAKKLIL